MKKIISTRWRSSLAYAIGLITTDGCLSIDGRHIDLTSKDLEQIKTFIRILGLKNKVGLKSSGSSNKKYYRVQFSNVVFYKFLLNIGLTPHKSKTIAKIAIPDKYFADFLRGCLDGDGNIYTYWDSIYKNSFRLYVKFTCASFRHLKWIDSQIKRLYQIEGKIRFSSRAYILIFAKHSSVQLLKTLYYQSNISFLERKHSKIINALGIIDEQEAGMGKLVNPLP